MTESIKTSDFERVRETLLNHYHSANISHSGLMIAVIISIFSLVANYKGFFEGGSFFVSLFYFCISAAIALGFYVIGRLFYWTALSNSVILITENQLYKYKDEIEQKPKDIEIVVDSEIPDIAYLQIFGEKRIHENNTKNPQVILSKCSVSRLFIYSIVVGILSYNLLVLFSFLFGALHL